VQEDNGRSAAFDRHGKSWITVDELQ